MRFPLTLAFFAVTLAGPALADDPAPNPRALAYTSNVCLWQAANRLDDHSSPADVIADGVAGACSTEEGAWRSLWTRGCSAILRDAPTDTRNFDKCVSGMAASDRRHRIDLVLIERAWRAKHPGQAPPATPYAPCSRPDGLCGMLVP